MTNLSHPNRAAHNWLIYDAGDRILIKHKSLYQGTIYDLGAGESPYKNFFLSCGQQYVAVDWNGSYHNTNADVIADLNEPIPVGAEVADTVVSFSVLEHLSEPQEMLKEAFRILKPGGYMLLQVPWQWRIHEAPFDFFRFTPYGLELLFQRAGFSDVLVEPTAGFFTTVILKINYFTTRFIRGPDYIRSLIRTVLTPIWYLGQRLAPLLDQLDRNWSAEAPGFYVKAQKPAPSEG
jgi:SAM-dependent methyltransferase